jgi:hypothetical protein
MNITVTLNLIIEETTTPLLSNLQKEIEYTQTR